MQFFVSQCGRSSRGSWRSVNGYERIAGDTYTTPDWCYDLLAEVEPWSVFSCDPCPANADYDMLEKTMLLTAPHIRCNPPFRIAERIIRHSLALTKPHRGKCAFLLPHAFDTAKCRRDLFEQAAVCEEAGDDSAYTVDEPGAEEGWAQLEPQLVRLRPRLRGCYADYGMAVTQLCAPAEATIHHQP